MTCPNWPFANIVAKKTKFLSLSLFFCLIFVLVHQVLPRCLLLQPFPGWPFISFNWPMPLPQVWSETCSSWGMCYNSQQEHLLGLKMKVLNMNWQNQRRAHRGTYLKKTSLKNKNDVCKPGLNA